MGRTELLATLGRLLDFDRSPEVRVVVLEGARGLGKTSLLEHLRDRLPPGGFARLDLSMPLPTPGELAAGLFRSLIEQVLGIEVDSEPVPARWLERLPTEARGAVAAPCAELRPQAHPARAFRSLTRAVVALAQALERRLVVALDHPDSLRRLAGFPGIPRQGVPLRKLVVASPWVRWVVTPASGASTSCLDDLEGVARTRLEALRRAESYHLSALLLETALRPVPRVVLWPLHGLSDGRPVYLEPLVLRVLQEVRSTRGVPGPEEVRAAFLREALEGTGRIGLACETAMGREAAVGVPRALVSLLAGRGALGIESAAQMLGISRARVAEELARLAAVGVLAEDEGRYRIEDRVLALRERLLARVPTGDPGVDRGLLAELTAHEEGEALDTHRGGSWERRLRAVLPRIDGRALPGRVFGVRGTVYAPSGGVEEAAVGFDARGAVDGFPVLQAADLLWNGRDRRWLVDMPRPGRALDAADLERHLRLKRFFQDSFRRPIEALWVASEQGFTPEARETARREGVLLSDPASLSDLETGAGLPELRVA